MRLPKGITGFHKAWDAPLSTVDLPTFKAMAYAAARAIAAKVIAFKPATYSLQNYHVAVLYTPQHTRSILCNITHPVIGFAHGRCESAYPDFIDAPDISVVFEQTGKFQVLKQSELVRYPSANILTELGEAEVAQIRYWKPQRIGDVVFNHWD